MVATPAQFEKLIDKLETFAQKQPHIYRLQVACLATLGYAYIFLILALTLALLTGFVLLMLNTQRISASAMKGMLFLLALTLIVLRSLWISFSPPVGVPLSIEDVPQLYAVVNEIASSLKTARFHHILLTDDFNAGVVQRPRLGLLGWYQNYLIVGLPLMLALSPAQFRAVLAHELGHLSGNHNRFSRWIYRQRLTWYRLEQALGQGGNESSRLVFEWFLKLYIPFFNAYSFVLARRNEYEADQCAVNITGAHNTAETLMNVKVKSRFLNNNFWSNIYNQVQTEIAAPSNTYTQMQRTLLQTIDEQETHFYLEEALAEETNHADTHPCLKARLHALGYLPEPQADLIVNTSITRSAAQELLGTSLEKFVEHFNQYWRKEVITSWQQKHTEIQQSLATLKQLHEKAETTQITLNEATQRAILSLEFEGEAAALPLLREIIAQDANHISANYILGEILLKQQDSTGIEHIEKAIAHDADAFIEGCRIIYNFLQQQGNLEQAQSYRRRAEQHYELILKAKRERTNLSIHDELYSHRLSLIEIDNLRQQLSGYPQIMRAYLLRKVVKYFPEKELYVLGVVRKVGFWETNYESENSELINALFKHFDFPHTIFIIILNSHLDIEKKIKEIPDVMIYSQQK